MGMSYMTTWRTWGKSRPRAARSVHTSSCVARGARVSRACVHCASRAVHAGHAHAAVPGPARVRHPHRGPRHVPRRVTVHADVDRDRRLARRVRDDSVESDTLGSPIRIPNYKNLGVDLAPEELRICPWAVGTRKFSGFSGAITSKSLKKSRCARPDDQLHDRYRDFAICDEKNEDPAKMTHSISDFLRRLRA